MADKQLLLGDEAVALGALHAGLSGVYAYPGTPSTEITEYIQGHPLTRERHIHDHWTTNEKTAMEGALGMSYAGKRSLVCMKHVGMNVCADPLMGSAMTGANGGLVVAACDDPSMHSSQNEQDSRFWGTFGMMPVFEPSNQQEAYEMTRAAFDYSEKRTIPVIMRLTTRMAHSRAVVTPTGDIRPQNELHYPEYPKRWVTLPVNARVRNRELIKDYAQFEEDAATSKFNWIADGPDHSMGVIACGIAYNYLMENYPDGCPYPVLKVSQYPFPRKLALKLAAMVPTILVLEEGQPLVENMLRGVFPSNTKIIGRIDETVVRDGELSPDDVRKALGLPALPTFAPSQVLAPRPPALCMGCGHRDFYTALNNVLKKDYPTARVFSDIGCYTLGYMAPFHAINTCVEMGASFTMAQGAAYSGTWPAVGVLGDSTFTHSGMTGLLDAVNGNADVVLCISDNLTTAMTGGQDSAGTGRIEAICAGLGVDPAHIRTIVPLPKNYPDMEKVIREEIEYHGVSVIVCRRECIQTARRHAKK
ncbi:MAG: indolepyruvate ferredoxin oxidoreductase [Bacteroidales bacterium]|jgi:indolepyruvate ferredoxin oxidoreductase alpha subunit|nr:indolepyruvate ferredoxin oxidoreductase [Bacteroidales bacterium]MBR4351963.1 indolepyruvate ferredoxin oxidoreductase [Bacteroidales bacterium]